MEKKTKLSISSTVKKSIKNIEIAKTQGKNSVVIEKKSNKFVSRNNFNRSTNVRSKPISSTTGSPPRTNFVSKPSSPITNDYEKRKLAEHRAARRLKGDSREKGKSGTKKR